ncbi:MAG: aryl-sulfate sulfotransferase [bacterium]|nr:aryl-sulfate sulfotransferase [bacterium]
MAQKYLIASLLSIVALVAANAQVFQNMTFPTFVHPSPGYFLIAQNSPDSVALIDHSGKNVFAVQANFPINLLSTDSTITYFDVQAKGFVRRNAQMVAIDTLLVSGGFPTDFHEGHILSNGNYVVVGVDKRVMNMAALVPGGKSQANVFGAVIQERTFSGSTVFEWKSLDHIPVVDATEDTDLTQPTIDYIHVNSVFREANGDFLISCRHTDEIIKVSRLTGQVLWRMGGEKSKGNQFTFIDDETDGFTGFSHQHDVSRTANGNIILFDNGNLKPSPPNPSSRVAEYEVNETAKTAKLVWSYRPTPDVHAMTMGSVQELPNTNVLIGFGTGNGTVVALEVSRNGTVQAEMSCPAGNTSYRVRKALFGMAGIERVVTAPGTVSFNQGSNATNITAVLSRVDVPTSIIVERHRYAPHDMSFDLTPCTISPVRWVIRQSPRETVRGSIRFNITSLDIKVPSLLKMYHRSVEGADAFVEVASMYDAASTSMVANTFLVGEYMIAYPMCFDPLPSIPANAATNVSNNVVLRWTAAVQTGGYDVEIYKGPTAVGVPVRSFHTARLDTSLLLPEPGSQYTWRVRAVRPAPNTQGQWSNTFSFRTRIGTATALWPSSLPDSVAIAQQSTFRWTKVKSAQYYRVRIVPLGTSVPALDTLVVDTAFTVRGNLPWNKTMQWFVRGEVNDTTYGDWSNTLFIVTPPCPPRLLLPASEQQFVNPESVMCTWAPIDGAKMYNIRVYKGVAGGYVWFEDSVTSTESEIIDMNSVTKYYWQVRTIGRYGAGPWSATQWFMTRGSAVLTAATLLAPVNKNDIDTLQATLAWASVIEASYYHVQLSSKPTFSHPDVEWTSLYQTTVLCPPLLTGKVYRWRVMALSDVASSPWSDTASFTTLPGPGNALEPLTPISGSTNVPVRGTVSYITDKRFNEYHVEYALVPLFTTAEQMAAVTGGFAPYSLLPEQQYWWRVIGFKNGVPTDTGSTATFTTGKGDTVTSVSFEERATGISVRLVGTTLVMEGAVQGASVRVMDIAGRAIHQNTLTADAHASEDLPPLASGVYIAVIRTVDSRVTVYSFVISSTR